MRHAIGKLVIPVLFAVLCGPASAQQGPIVALFDMEDRGAGFSKQVLDNLTEYLALRLAERGFQIIPREQVRERLAEQKKDSFRSCFEQSCQIELGRELAAQKALAARILKIADTCQVGATLYDLKRATTEKAASAEASCSEKSLLEAIKIIAVKLTGQAEPVAPAPEPQPAAQHEDLKTPPVFEPRPPATEPTASATAPENPPATAVSEAPQETGAPASPFDSLHYALGAKVGGVSPSRGVDSWVITVSKDGYPGEDSKTNIDPGFWAQLYFDWRLSFPLNLGVVSSFFTADTVALRVRDRSNKIGFLTLAATAKYRWRVHRTVEIRPVAMVGLGIVTAGATWIEEISENVDNKGFIGISLGASVECAWYLSDSFGLNFDLGFVSSPVTKGKFGDYNYTMTFPPFVYLAAGGEFGF